MSPPPVLAVREIPPRDTWALRHQVLRRGHPIESCDWVEDRLDGAFHLCLERDGAVVGIASFYPLPLPGSAPSAELGGGGGWQLRGMAVADGARGGGLGAVVLREGLGRAWEREAGYVWCNARTRALSFYLRAGFKCVSEEFEIPGVGPHRRMRLARPHRAHG